jgi:transposase
MAQEPHRAAAWVLWIVNNGSSNRDHRARAWLQAEWRPTLVLVHAPIHTSWLNQIEIYFSIIHRKVLTPNDFTSLAEVEDRLLAFQDHYGKAATPFH